MKNPHIIVDPATKRCLCGSYQMPWRNPPNESVPVSCREILDCLESTVQDGGDSAFVLNQVIMPLVEDRG